VYSKASCRTAPSVRNSAPAPAAYDLITVYCKLTPLCWYLSFDVLKIGGVGRRLGVEVQRGAAGLDGTEVVKGERAGSRS